MNTFFFHVLFILSIIPILGGCKISCVDNQRDPFYFVKNLFKKIYFYKADFCIEKERQRQEMSSGSYLKLLMRLEPSGSEVRSLDLPLCLPHRCRNPKTWPIFCYFLRHTSRVLDCKWINQGLNWHPYEMPEKQQAAKYILPQ